MVRPISGVAAGGNFAPQPPRKEPPKKRPLQISEELHLLVSMLASDRGQSMEQVVSSAVTKMAKTAPVPSDGERQIQYRRAIYNAEEEIKLRYHSERSRRSVQMRRINAERRKNRATPTPDTPQRPTPISNPYGYPVEYRYGFAVPKPPPSSYPTYFH